MRKLLSLSVLILVAAASAQTPTPQLAAYPDLTPTVAAGAAISNTLDVMKGNIATTFQLEQNDAAAITTHTGQIAALQDAVNDPVQGNSALLAQIQALQSQLKALQAQLPSVSGYALGYSLSSNRAAIQNLSGATIKGSVFIFSVAASNIAVANPTGIASVCYLLNGKAIRNDCETQTPYDFIGGSVTAALPWDSTTVSNGQNSITQTVTKTSGAVEVDTISFTVAN